MRRYSTAERIVFEFQNNVTECHRRAIEVTLGITSDDFDRCIPRARELAAELDPPLRLTPIYERDGWWTSRPTERIMAIAEHEALKRNLAEHTRNARVLSGTKLAEFARYASASLEGTVAAYMAHHAALLEISETADYIIGAVDAALPNLYVLREKEAAAA